MAIKQTEEYRVEIAVTNYYAFYVKAENKDKAEDKALDVYHTLDEDSRKKYWDDDDLEITSCDKLVELSGEDLIIK